MKAFKKCKISAISLMVLGFAFFLFGLFRTEHLEYGGDAYTGIQNAAADTANNIIKVGGLIISALGFGLLSYSEIKTFEYEENQKNHQELLKALSGEMLINSEQVEKSKGVEKIDIPHRKEAKKISGNLTFIRDYEYFSSKSLTFITIPASVTYIGNSAFACCFALVNISFEGTVEQWNAIAFGDDWNSGVPATEVICSNGTVPLN